MDTYCKTEEMITKYAKLYKIGQLVHERTQQWGHIFCSLLWKLNKGGAQILKGTCNDVEINPTLQPIEWEIFEGLTIIMKNLTHA